jgi:PTH2 family peptidyl-tRNA hydrolase
MKVKQVIVVRKDLKMRRGKAIAQGAHASMKIFFDQMYKIHFSKGDYHWTENCEDGWLCHLDPEMEAWKEGAFTKVCVYVNSEKELLEIVRLGKQAGLPTALITDSGRTEFDGVPTNTCCAIGPALSSKIDVITGDLPLY